MSLSVGDKLGPYEILAFLGAGGMGEVYRARDTRLGREVAIKASAEQFSDRFTVEARAIAALNHPNICQLYDTGPNYLVMELIEGEPLASVLKNGPLPLQTALNYSQQIAAALEAAHDRGIIHRDLKPGNILVKSDGTIKVLDFGLAKSVEQASSDSQNSPTQTMSPTRAGVILGTAAYMAPEQARGKAVDKRADIWAFGVVVYEMVTGERAFSGDSAAELLGAVIHKEADLSRVPLKIRRLLAKCLEKDPRQRLQAIGDWRLLLDEAPDAPSRSRVGIWQWAGWVAAALLAVVAVWMWLRTPAPEPRTVTRSAFNVATPAFFPALSRDGTRLAYYVVSGGPPQVYLRMMDQLEGRPVPGAEGVIPVFSPDGQWILYEAGPSPLTLKKIPVTGGAAVTICDIPSGRGWDWGSDDTIVFGTSTGLMRVPAAGGTPQSLSTVNKGNGESGHYRPQIVPGGQAVIFTIGTGSSPDASRIGVLDLKTRAYRVLVNAGHDGFYVPTGHLVYMRGTTLFAAPFDLKRLSVTGPETPVVEGLNLGQYSFSDTSLMVFNTSSTGGLSRPLAKLEWTDRNGVAQPLPDPPRRWGMIALSPDGKRVAGSIRESNGAGSDIWLYDLERRTLTRLTFNGFNFQPVWTPDGKWVTYAFTSGEGKHGIYRVPADKSSQPELLIAGEGFNPGSWTPDGKALLYTAMRGKRQNWVLPALGAGVDNKPSLFTRTAFNETYPVLSPDGKWVAYESDESGKYEVYVEPFPGPGGKTQISTQGGYGAVWARNGRELFYIEPSTWQLMAVDIATGPQFRAGSQKALFKVTATSVDDILFDVTPDPKRFLVGRVEQEGNTGSTFVIITNWFDDLRRRAPVGK